MGQHTSFPRVLAAAFAFAAITTAGAVSARQQAARYTAFAVNMAGSGSAASGTVEMIVERWSTPEEQEQVMNTLVEQGGEKLLDTIRKLPRVGAITTPGSVGFDIRFAQRTQNPDGTTRVVLLTDRPIQFWEQWSQSRSLDYPYTMVDMRLLPNGTGEGRLSVAAKISYERSSKTMMIERLTDQPVRLQDVKTVN